MGNTTSSGVTLDELKNQVFGAAVFMLSQRLDTELNFVELNAESEQQAHTLPQAGSSNILEAAVGYYGNPNRADTDPFVEAYVNNHVLDSQEHIHEFLQLLVAKLRPSKRDTESVRSTRLLANNERSKRQAQTNLAETRKQQTSRRQQRRVYETERLKLQEINENETEEETEDEEEEVSVNEQAGGSRHEAMLRARAQAEQERRRRAAAEAQAQATTKVSRNRTRPSKTARQIDHRLNELNQQIDNERSAMELREQLERTDDQEHGNEEEHGHAEEQREIDINELMNGNEEEHNDHDTVEGDYEQESFDHEEAAASL